MRPAVTFALRSVGNARPLDPVALLAEKLMEYNAAHGTAPARTEPAPPAAGGAGAGGGDEEDAAEQARMLAARGRGKNRRQVVFSEPVKLDKEFKPVVIPKTDEEKAEISAVMAANILFKGMDDDARRLIVDSMSLKSFAPGDTIIKQGDMGDFYYVVSEGMCDILVGGKKVVELGKGRGFGELALMYDAPRAATVLAKPAEDGGTGVKAWAVDRDTFKHIMIGTTIRKREMYEAFLRAVPIFSTLTREEILTIAGACSASQ